jgi:hypothetical protein
MVRKERARAREREKRERERVKRETMECVIDARQNRTSKGTAARKDSPDSIQSLAFQIHFLRDQVRDGHVKLEMCRYSECFLRFDEELGPTCF